MAAILIIGICCRKVAIVPLVVVAATVVSGVLQYKGAIVGTIPSGLPRFTVPSVDLSSISIVLQSALVIALISYVEGISIAKSLAARTRDSLNPNQELIGQGLANITSAFSGTGPVGGSFGRSAVNFEAGAKSGFSAVLAGLFMAITLLFFTPLFYCLPQAVLAAVVITAVIKLVDIRQSIDILKKHRYDGIVIIVTFVATLAFAPHIERGIIVGVVLSVLLFVYSASQHQVLLFRCDDADYCEIEHVRLNQFATNRLVSGMCFDRSLTFANATYFEQKMQEAVKVNPEAKYVLVMARGINEVDASGQEVIEKMVEKLREQGITMVVSGLKMSIKEAFRKYGLENKIGSKNIYPHANEALEDVFHKENGEVA